jgi:ADP-heptose:LPS heptosyltransferase
VLLLGALRTLREAYPGARLTLMTGTPYAAAAGMCPFVDDVLAVDRHQMRDGSPFAAVRGIIRLASDLRNRRFDLVVDFHSFRETNLLSWVSGARLRIGMKRSDRAYLPFCFNLDPVLEDKSLHVAEMFRRVALGAARRDPAMPGSADSEFTGGVLAIPPALSEEVRRRHLSGLEGRSVLAIYTGASVSARRWAPDGFAEVARYALESWGAGVVVLTGISEEEEGIGREIVRLAGAGNVRLVTGLPIPELAALMAECRSLVANDSGPMHLGGAVGVPTLGIFSASLPVHYRPMGAGTAYVHEERMEDVHAGAVIGKLIPLWESGR